ncbi:hypothetical protein ABW19_dt0202083 [Dactylella cylindrospora]|nr:hypothetical protein ABW19_dt0202083 [Dactylella cylindrospora]
MDDLYTRSYLVTRQNYRTGGRPTTQQRRRRTSFGRRSSSVPSKDRKKLGDAKLDAHEELDAATQIPELDGKALDIDTHKVITADLTNPIPRRLSRRQNKRTSPTTPRSPEIEVSDNRTIAPKTTEVILPDSDRNSYQMYRKNSSSELRPPSRNQLSLSSGSSTTLNRKMSSETYISNATTISPNYAHEREREREHEQDPDSPTLPAFPAMPNPKVIASTPRHILGLVTQGLGGQGGSNNSGLPVLPSDRSGSVASISTLTRRKSSRTPSSALAPSPNPFLMRDLPESLRDLVLDQGLSVRLRDGSLIEMSSDDVQCAKNILNAWNIYEGNLGGGISRKLQLALLKGPKNRMLLNTHIYAHAYAPGRARADCNKI